MVNVLKFYDKWNIQGLVLLSLCLQIILLSFAPFRKRSRNEIIIAPIWLAYTLADPVATFAIGLISDHQRYSPEPNDDHAAILAFWVPFLLIHLGGPDNATAFSLEDTTFWKRHIFQLLRQVVPTFIVILETFDRKKLWICTLLVAFAGAIKCVERICALYFADLSKYQESLIGSEPMPNYDHIVKLWKREKPAEPRAAPKPSEGVGLSDVDVVVVAYEYLKIFKGLVVDIIPKKDVAEGKRPFPSQNSTEAFRVLEVELNLIYEVFYTKAVVLYQKRGWILRFVSWYAIVAALLIFCSTDKNDFRYIDVKITYALLFCAIGFDMIALFMLAISDWTIVYIEKRLKKGRWKGSLANCFYGFLKYFLTLKRIKRVSDDSKFVCFDWFRKFLFGFFYWVRGVLFWRWSGSLHTCNFIDYCLKGRHVENPRGIRFHKDFYVSKEPLEEKLWHFIFTQLHKKAPNHGNQQDRNLNNSSKESRSCDNNDYYKTLLIWHIATDLCYENKLESDSDSQKISKILSDYMLYLLVIQPTLISAVSGIVKIRFRDTCNEAKAFLRQYVPKKESRKKERTKVREEFLKIDPTRSFAELKDTETEFVLLQAFCLVKKLEHLCSWKRWKLISEVWVELLSYAASHSVVDIHIAQLSKGGELITFIWLLEAHLGLIDNFQSYKGIDNLVDHYMQQCPIIKS